MGVNHMPLGTGLCSEGKAGHIVWEELKGVEGRAEHLLEDDLGDLSRKGRKTFPVLRYEGDESRMSRHFSLLKKTVSKVSHTIAFCSNSGQLPIRPTLGALKGDNRGSKRRF